MSNPRTPVLPPEKRAYLNQREAADQLRCDPDTIARLRRQGWFPHALDRHGGSLYPWCCLKYAGVEHERELILPSVREAA